MFLNLIIDLLFYNNLSFYGFIFINFVFILLKWNLRRWIKVLDYYIYVDVVM